MAALQLDGASSIKVASTQPQRRIRNIQNVIYSRAEDYQEGKTNGATQMTIVGRKSSFNRDLVLDVEESQ